MIEKMMDPNIIDYYIINCAIPSIIVTIENRYQIDFGRPGQHLTNGVLTSRHIHEPIKYVKLFGLRHLFDDLETKFCCFGHNILNRTHQYTLVYYTHVRHLAFILGNPTVYYFRLKTQ